jgi:hypothetical protein
MPSERSAASSQRGAGIGDGFGQRDLAGRGRACPSCTLSSHVALEFTAKYWQANPALTAKSPRPLPDRVGLRSHRRGHGQRSASLGASRCSLRGMSGHCRGSTRSSLLSPHSRDLSPVWPGSQQCLRIRVNPPRSIPTMAGPTRRRPCWCASSSRRRRMSSPARRSAATRAASTIARTIASPMLAACLTTAISSSLCGIINRASAKPTGMNLASGSFTTTALHNTSSRQGSGPATRPGAFRPR